ncbi:MAG: hypothetical protein GX178_10265 [Acidobacteria bacterium]|nr:hypothetical protein [Thermoanaerobaculia bacterium]MDI9630958.1 hypothetical protein [Acidobacteriota bacterium]MBP7812085.1 hypothetical protein [Thermoanaerobaculia bacterium]MBP8845704.1 hypothetical protein [Thermoanaerobaculia bacterium]NLN11977.1 hypothetical protein [Acidobacteriota bacterium]
MRRAWWSALALSCVFVLCGSAARGESCAPYLDSAQPGELILGYQLSGTKTPAGYLKLSLEAGPIATRAIRIYSEPSHSLLVVALDSAFRSTQEGAAWESSVLQGSPDAALLTVEPLAGGQATITIAPRPEGDERIHVYVFGCWPDGTLEDRLLADAGVEQDEFTISSALPSAPHPE